MFPKKASLKNIYNTLLKEYGTQRWWPTTPRGKEKPVYNSGPKNEQQIFEVMVGAILTQNTAWQNVEQAIVNINREKIMNPEKLNNLSKCFIAKTIRPSGYFNMKAQKLKNLAVFIVNNPIKIIKKLPANKLREKLLEVNGIGPETADSIILYAFNKPTFVIDAYTKRIFSRLGLCHESVSYDELQKLFTDKLPCEAELFNEYHALIVKHAKESCRKTPLCSECCIKEKCSFS